MSPTDSEAANILDGPIGLHATGLRQEFDSLGKVEVPADHYWGAQTQGNLEHFNIGHDVNPGAGARAEPAQAAPAPPTCRPLLNCPTSSPERRTGP